jgi:hypothetical protein
VYEQLGSLFALTFGNAARFSGGKYKGSHRAMSGQDGRTKEAQEILRTLEAVSRERYVPLCARTVHAGLGDRNAVFDWLNRAYTARDVISSSDRRPKWDGPGRSRFTALVARCGFTRGATTAPLTP